MLLLLENKGNLRNALLPYIQHIYIRGERGSGRITGVEVADGGGEKVIRSIQDKSKQIRSNSPIVQFHWPHNRIGEHKSSRLLLNPPTLKTRRWRRRRRPLIRWKWSVECNLEQTCDGIVASPPGPAARPNQTTTALLAAAVGDDDTVICKNGGRKR